MVPPALLLLALVALGVAAARPHREVPISSTATTVLLALDVSRSMCSTDVPPNRLGGPAGSDRLHRGTTGGLSDRAGDLRRFRHRDGAPTDDTEALVRHRLARDIAGHGDRPGHPGVHRCHRRLDPSVAPTGADVPDTAAPDDAAAVIVLLTDGSNGPGSTQQRQRSRPPIEDPRLRDRVQETGASTQRLQRRTGRARWRLRCGPGSLEAGAADRPDDRRGNPPRGCRPLGSTYYRAESADQLTDALADLPQHIATAKESVDVAAWFATLAAVLAAAAFAMATWLNRTLGDTAPIEAHHGWRCAGGLFACTVTGDGPAGTPHTATQPARLTVSHPAFAPTSSGGRPTTTSA